MGGGPSTFLGSTPRNYHFFDVTPNYVSQRINNIYPKTLPFQVFRFDQQLKKNGEA